MLQAEAPGRRLTGYPYLGRLTVAVEPQLTAPTGSEDRSELRLASGHVGFVAGRSASKVARPRIADWIRRHSDAVATEDRPAPPSRVGDGAGERSPDAPDDERGAPRHAGERRTSEPPGRTAGHAAD